MAPSSVRMALEGTSDTPKLEELVSREALAELIGSVVELFRIPIRVYSETSGLLVDTAQEHEACKYVNSVFAGRSLCGSTVSAVKGLVPEEGDISHPCFTGQKYRVVAVEYESRRIGRLVIGPYLPADLTEVPESLANVAEVELEKVALVLVKSPRAKEETIRKLSEHVRRQLDLVLFSGHKTLLTSQMHLASVTESFREMQEKNRKLEDANQRLRELDRLKTNFLATVSHELRTPLTSIIGYGEMLAEGIAGELNKEQQEFVATIREKGEQLLGLISGLLDLSKLESGTLSVKKRPVTVRSRYCGRSRPLTGSWLGCLPVCFCTASRARAICRLTGGRPLPESGNHRAGLRGGFFGAIRLCAWRVLHSSCLACRVSRCCF